MKGLLTETPNALNSIISTKLVTRSSVLIDLKKAAATASASLNTVETKIKTNPYEQEEADRINMFRLAPGGHWIQRGCSCMNHQSRWH